MPAGHRGHCQPRKRRLARLDCIGYEELLGVDAVMQRQSRELQVNPDIEASGGPQRHSPGRQTTNSRIVRGDNMVFVLLCSKAAPHSRFSVGGGANRLK